jgi:hypothetical protein
MWWHDQEAPFPQLKKTLGRYLGPTKHIGPVLTAKILKSKGKIVARSSFTAISVDEMEQPNIKENIARFTLLVNKALRSKVTVKGPKNEETPNSLPYSNWDGQKDPVTIPDGDEYDVSTYDPYLHSQVYLSHEGEAKLAKVKFRKRDSDGNLIGRAAANPIQDTQSTWLNLKMDLRKANIQRTSFCRI